MIEMLWAMFLQCPSKLNRKNIQLLHENSPKRLLSKQYYFHCNSALSSTPWTANPFYTREDQLTRWCTYANCYSGNNTKTAARWCTLHPWSVFDVIKVSKHRSVLVSSSVLSCETNEKKARFLRVQPKSNLCSWNAKTVVGRLVGCAFLDSTRKNAECIERRLTGEVWKHKHFPWLCPSPAPESVCNAFPLMSLRGQQGQHGYPAARPACARRSQQRVNKGAVWRLQRRTAFRTARKTQTGLSASHHSLLPPRKLWIYTISNLTLRLDRSHFKFTI